MNGVIKTKFILNILLLVAILLPMACEKEKPSTPAIQEAITPDLPVIKTLPIIQINATSAIAAGKLLTSTVTCIEQGICWSPNPNVSIENFRTSNKIISDSFESRITRLQAKTKYYYRAYARNSAGCSYGDELIFTTSIDTGHIVLGEYYRGGYIFYIDYTGKHGLIAATIDQGSAYWGCQGTSITGGTATVIGGGQLNTTRILATCKTSGIAAKLCNDLVLNGYSDWFLPAKDELNKMHENLYLKNIGNFKTVTYWSSSQYNSQNAWRQFFNLNLIQNYYDKDLLTCYVRAARSF